MGIKAAAIPTHQRNDAMKLFRHLWQRIFIWTFLLVMLSNLLAFFLFLRSAAWKRIVIPAGCSILAICASECVRGLRA